MSRRLRWLTVLLSLSTVQCTGLILNAALGPQPGAPDTSSEAQRCSTLGDQPIAYQEELAVGQALAVRWVNSAGGLALTLPKGATLETLRAGNVSLPRSAMNEVTHYVNLVGKNLAAQSARPDIDWTFGILDNPGFNSFSAPGGYVLITRGTLDRISNEAELAGILGHEIAHITQKHAIRLYAKHKVTECYTAMGMNEAKSQMAGAVVGALPVPGIAADQLRGVFESVLTSDGFLDLNAQKAILGSITNGLFGTFVARGYDEPDEYEADRVGLELAIRAGYNPRPFIDFIGRVPGGAHHPPGPARKAALEQWLKTYCSGPREPWTEACPFDKYPTVPLKNELKLAAKS